MAAPPASRPRATWALLVVLVAVAEAAVALRMGSGARFFDAVRVVYAAHTVYLPGLLFVASAVLWRRKRRAARLAAAVGLALVTVRIWCTHVEPAMLLVRRVRVETGKLPRPLRVLHLSDMQPDRVGWHEARVMAKARALAPDLLLYTGDLVQPHDVARTEREIARMADLLDGVRPPLGKVAIPGDTDHRLEGLPPDRLGGLLLLSDEEMTIDLPDGGRVQLLGLALDQSRANVRRRVLEWMGRCGPRDVTIAMGHAPDYVLSLHDAPVDLCLAGHTHGGQVAIPFLGPPHIASMVPRAWAKGLHAFGRTRVNVSAGAGAEHGWDLPSIRFNCPTEMTLVELS